jgi:hypothetical protein
MACECPVRLAVSRKHGLAFTTQQQPSQSYVLETQTFGRRLLLTVTPLSLSLDVSVDSFVKHHITDRFDSGGLFAAKDNQGSHGHHFPSFIQVRHSSDGVWLCTIERLIDLYLHHQAPCHHAPCCHTHICMSSSRRERRQGSSYHTFWNACDAKAYKPVRALSRRLRPRQLPLCLTLRRRIEITPLLAQSSEDLSSESDSCSLSAGSC